MFRTPPCRQVRHCAKRPALIASCKDPLWSSVCAHLLPFSPPPSTWFQRWPLFTPATLTQAAQRAALKYKHSTRCLSQASRRVSLHHLRTLYAHSSLSAPKIIQEGASLHLWRTPPTFSSPSLFTSLTHHARPTSTRTSLTEPLIYIHACPSLALVAAAPLTSALRAHPALGVLVH